MPHVRLFAKKICLLDFRCVCKNGDHAKFNDGLHTIFTYLKFKFSAIPDTHSIAHVNRNVQRVLLGLMDFIITRNITETESVRLAAVKFLLRFESAILSSSSNVGPEDGDLHVDYLTLWYKLGTKSILSETFVNKNYPLFNSNMLRIVVRFISSSYDPLATLAAQIIIDLVTRDDVPGHITQKFMFAIMAAFINCLQDNEDSVIDIQRFVAMAMYMNEKVSENKKISEEAADRVIIPPGAISHGEYKNHMGKRYYI